MQLPQQSVFDGEKSWKVSYSFEAMSKVYRWEEDKQRFRLKISLRGEAAEYTFRQVSDDTQLNYKHLLSAIKTRFREKRSASSYLDELEKRQFSKNKETLAEYIADIERLVLKEYPTTDSRSGETINLRHFLRGLLDTKEALFIWMKEPKSIEEGREIF